MRKLQALSVVFALALAGCADLAELPANSCGNGVIEEGEDCDSFEPAAGLHCARPGEVSACRFVCDPGATPPVACPAGRACGLDGVCRAPAGRFEPASRDFPVSVARLAVGDFDGDGRADLLAVGEPDLIGKSATSIVFFDDQGAVEEALPLPGFLGAPVVGRLTSAAHDDLAFLSLPGLSTLIGQPDRSLQPLAYPFLQQTLEGTPTLRAVRLPSPRTQSITSSQDDQLLLLLDQTDAMAPDGITSILSSERRGLDAAQALVNPLPHHLVDLSGQPATGLLLDPTNQACPQLAVAFKGESKVQVYTPCRLPDPGGQAGGLLEVSLVIPTAGGPPGTIIGPPRMYDIDGDGFLDLLVEGSGTATVTNPETGETSTIHFSTIFVAYGTGQGHLSSRPPAGCGEAFPDVAFPYFPRVWAGGAGDAGAGGMSGDGGPGGQAGQGGKAGQGGQAGQGAGGECAGQAGESAVSFSVSLSPLRAVGDLDGDKKADFVTDSLVLLSGNLVGDATKPADQSSIVLSALGQWTDARIADLNHDGLGDVITTSGTTAALDVYLNAAGRFNRNALVLEGEPGNLEVGDFDGDRVLDLAFSERASGSSSPDQQGDSLAVLFGSTEGYPRELVRMGRFDEIQQVMARDVSLEVQDGITDLDVLSRSADQKTFLVAQLYGASERQLRAPLGLLRQTCDQQDFFLPLAVAAGPVLAHPDGTRDDLVAVGINGDSAEQRVSVVSLQDDGRYQAQSISGVLPRDVQLFRDSLSLQGRLLTGDLDGDGRHEILLLASRRGEGGAGGMDGAGGSEAGDCPGGSGGGGAGGAAGGGPGGGGASGAAPLHGVLLVLRADGTMAAPGVISRSAFIDLPLIMDENTQARLIDVDGDKHTDLLLLANDADGKPSLRVFWNDGKGGFDAASSATIALPARGAVGAPKILDFCLLRPAPSLELALLGEKQVYRARGAGRSLTVEEMADTSGQPLPGGIAVACGDMDGDGVIDLVVGNALRARLHRGAEARK